MTIIYVEQYGAWWKLTPEHWHGLLEGGCLGWGHELPSKFGRLTRRPPLVGVTYPDGPEGRPSYFARRDDVLVYRPLDWEPNDYFAALDDLVSKGE